MPISCNLYPFGVALPEETLPNSYFENIVETNNQWIVERTGIKFRRRISENENSSDIGFNAAVKALENAAVSPANLSHIVVSTCTPDNLTPSVACIIGGKLSAPNIMAFDIEAACTGFIYGISICRSILAGEPDSQILLVCTEAMTRRINWQDRNTCILFGDASAACVINGNTASNFLSLLDVTCKSDGKLKDLIIVGGGTSCQYAPDSQIDDKFFISMQGRETYKYAVREMVNVCEDILSKNGISIKDIDLFVPHQANMRIVEAVGARLDIGMEKVFTNVENYGNTSAASIPLALAEADISGRIKPDSLILVTAFGAGLTWGAALFRSSR